LYIKFNRLCETDPEFMERAKSAFRELENGDNEKIIRLWRSVRDTTIKELKSVYSRLGRTFFYLCKKNLKNYGIIFYLQGITFDHFHGESMYGKSSEEILSLLKQRNVLFQSDDGRQVVKVKDQQVTIVKSDGTSLYITRDLAAAKDRWETFQPDKMYYVVEIGQSNHFQNLRSILDACEFDWSKNLEHIRFGRISGMSTRKGTAVFLSDILDESFAQMLEKMDMSR